ncbi:MAG: protein TolR [Deltaproteobacteria bacterium]|nr:protein TolR [Deltaproteobacteria bacterium]
MGFSPQSSDHQQPLSEINVTPFVDVMLVLLIIFMVTAPMIQQGVEIDLPKTDAKGSVSIAEKDIVVSIDKNKNIFIGEKQTSEKDLTEALQTIFKNKQVKVAYLKSDQKVDYGFVVQIMSALKNAGVENVGLVTENPL